MLQWILIIIACISEIRAFTCPDDNRTFYYVDVTTKCQVYHLCENSQMKTFRCLSGKAFNRVTSKCEDASSLICRNNLHFNTWTEFQNADDAEAKVNLSDPSAAIKFAGGVLQGISHKSVEGIIFSNKHSNATHLDFKSVYDLFNSTSENMKALSLEEYDYLSEMHMDDPHSRFKRDSEGPDIVYSFIRLLFNNIIKDLIDNFFGDMNSFVKKVILPTIDEMLENPESRYDFLGLWLSAKSAYSPLGWEILKRQKYNTPEGTIIKIPRKIVNDANAKFQSDSIPIIYKLLERHLGGFFHRAGDNVPLLIQNLKSLDKANYTHSGLLNDAILNFVLKHGKLLQSSTSSHVNFYTLTEIVNDFNPIKVALFQIIIGYNSQNNEKFLEKYIGEDSLVRKPVLESTEESDP